MVHKTVARQVGDLAAAAAGILGHVRHYENARGREITFLANPVRRRLV